MLIEHGVSPVTVAGYGLDLELFFGYMVDMLIGWRAVFEEMCKLPISIARWGV